MSNEDLIRRLRTTKRASAKTSKIKWSEIIRHPDDNKQLAGERDARLHAKRYSESADERDGRICAFKGVDGAGVLDIGHDHNRSNPMRQAITYSKREHKWVDAASYSPFDKVTQLRLRGRSKPTPSAS